MKDWKTLTSKQKIARLNKQLVQIKDARILLDEFEDLTTEWIKKVETSSKSDVVK